MWSFIFHILLIMDKKEYLIKILSHLEPVWVLAKWLKVLVEQWNFDDNMLDILIDAVEWAINTAKSDFDKEKLQKWLDAMKKMKELEEKCLLEYEKDLADLDSMLDNI